MKPEVSYSESYLPTTSVLLLVMVRGVVFKWVSYGSRYSGSNDTTDNTAHLVNFPHVGNSNLGQLPAQDGTGLCFEHWGQGVELIGPREPGVCFVIWLA